MLSTLLTVLPIFALILVGWLARRLGALGPHATTELNRFVVWLALPALLFDVMAKANWSELWQPGFIAAFAIGGLVVFALTVAGRLLRGAPLPDAAVDGLNTAYPNTGYMGFPLGVLALGPGAVGPVTLAMILTVCGIFGVGIVCIEIGLRTEKGRGSVAVKVAKALGKNPLLVAPALGALVSLSGLSLPAPAETFLKLLGEAASPCALVALGLFLAADRTAAPVSNGLCSLYVLAKLVVQPVVTWVLAALVFRLSPSLTIIATLLAALPTGTGPFMLAEYYNREASMTARVILISTVLSVLTVSGYLAWVL